MVFRRKIPERERFEVQIDADFAAEIDETVALLTAASRQPWSRARLLRAALEAAVPVLRHRYGRSRDALPPTQPGACDARGVACADAPGELDRALRMDASPDAGAKPLIAENSSSLPWPGQDPPLAKGPTWSQNPWRKPRRKTGPQSP